MNKGIKKYGKKTKHEIHIGQYQIIDNMCNWNLRRRKTRERTEKKYLKTQWQRTLQK